MDSADFEALPATLTIRELKVAGKVLVTTLSDTSVHLSKPENHFGYGDIELQDTGNTSAPASDVLPRSLSFKHSVQLWTAWRKLAPFGMDEGDWQQLLLLIGESKAGHHPGHPKRIKNVRPKLPKDVELPSVI